MSTNKQIAIVGTGNLGSSLAEALHAAGYEVGELVVTCSASPHHRRLARKIGAALHSMSAAELSAGIVWICVPDDAIRVIAGRLAPRTSWKSKVVLHSSGALASGELAALRRRGAHVGSAHPMMTYVKGAPAQWKGIAFALEGDAEAVRFGRQMARRLGMHPFLIAAASKPLYHATGSLASPMLVALLRTAERAARAAGIPREEIPRVVRPILLKTLDNYFRHGAEAAFSGPLRRGDVATIRRHVRVLKKVPGAVEVYRALVGEALRTLPVARKKEMRKVISGR